MTPLRIAVAGCCGRMGHHVIQAAESDEAVRVVAALTHPDDARIGESIGSLAGIPRQDLVIASDTETECDVLIDFTTPAACRHWTQWCVARGIALVSGTTGLSDAEHSALLSAAGRIPIVWAANMSVGLNVLRGLVQQAAERLGAEWDVELVEFHHRRKLDAPSGTARALVEAVTHGREAATDSTLVFGRRHDRRPRAEGEIGVHAVRMGGVIGEHDVYFASEGEVLSLRHSVQSRATFALGALQAARWVVDQRPHLYDMRNVLGFA
jgi:4-hydroxy-tetrahydrodipicolinate reductase